MHEEIFLDNQSSRYIFGDLNNSLVALASQRNGNDERFEFMHALINFIKLSSVSFTSDKLGHGTEKIKFGLQLCRMEKPLKRLDSF